MQVDIRYDVSLKSFSDYVSLLAERIIRRKCIRRCLGCRHS